MSAGSKESETTTLSPDEAFSMLGNETRMEILQTLGAADEPLSFSALCNRVGRSDSGNFSYHLDKLEGHFVQKTADGYRIRQAGSRVIEAVLSGAVTEAPVVESTRIDQSCPFCGAPIEVSFRAERVEMFCTECAGIYGDADSQRQSNAPAASGHLGGVHLPPAGVQDRTPVEMVRTAFTWGNLHFLAAAGGVCPRCSAILERSVDACETHDPAADLCGDCGHRHAVQSHYSCTNCNFDQRGVPSIALLDTIEFQTFLTDHGINPIAPSPERYLTIGTNYEEEILSMDPFEARFTFTIDGDALTLTVDDDLNVVEVTTDTTAESD